MKHLLLALAYLVCVFSEINLNSLRSHYRYPEFLQWQLLHKQLGKIFNYNESSSEQETRFKHYLWHKMNAELNNHEYGGTAYFGVNGLSDLSPDEINSMKGFKPSTNTNTNSGNTISKRSVHTTAPTGYFNWCNPATNNGKSVCSPIKYQGLCGSCWAYTSVEVLESVIMIQKNVSNVTLSPQQLIDCYVDPDTQAPFGCGGGPIAFDYVKGSPIALDVQYPGVSNTTNTAGTCKMSATPHPNGVGSLTVYLSEIAQDENAMATALKQYGPLALMICADSSWNTYTSGVMLSSKCDRCNGSANHAVQLIGYDMTGSVPAWIIRNSWSTYWGQGGYALLQFGNNTCGLANFPPQAIVTSVFNTGNTPSTIPSISKTTPSPPKTTPSPPKPTPSPPKPTPSSTPTPSKTTPSPPKSTPSSTPTPGTISPSNYPNCIAQTDQGPTPCINPDASFKSQFTQGICSPFGTPPSYFCVTKYSSSQIWGCNPANCPTNQFFQATTVNAPYYKTSNAQNVDGSLYLADGEIANQVMANSHTLDQITYSATNLQSNSAPSDSQTTSQTSNPSFIATWMGVGIIIGIVVTVIVTAVVVGVVRSRNKYI